MIHKIIGDIKTRRRAEREAELYRNLIRREARLGGRLFGPVPAGGRREFFCLDEHTWVWHEEWVEGAGQRRVRTTRYDVRPTGVLKSQDGQYQHLSREEAWRLRDAARLYYDRVRAELYPFV